MSTKKKPENHKNKENLSAAGGQKSTMEKTGAPKNVGKDRAADIVADNAPSTSNATTSSKTGAKKVTNKTDTAAGSSNKVPRKSMQKANSETNSEMKNILLGLAKDMKDMNGKVGKMWTDMYELDEDNGYEYDHEYELDSLDYGEEEYYQPLIDEDGPPVSKRQKLTDNHNELDQAKGNEHDNDSASSAGASNDNEDAQPEPASRFKNMADKYDIIAENTCDDIDEGLTRMINNAFQKGIQKAKIDELIEATPRPANATGLRSVRVNTLIWNLLQRPTRSFDEKLQLIQTCMAKTGIKVARMVQLINDPHRLRHIDEIIDLGSDALAMLGHAFHHFALRRRELMKEEVDTRYRDLCTADIPHTALLFGDNLEDEIKKIGLVNQTKYRVRPKRGGFGFRGGRMRRRGGGIGYQIPRQNLHYREYNSAARARPSRGWHGSRGHRGRGFRGMHRNKTEKEGEEVSLSRPIARPIIGFRPMPLSAHVQPHFGPSSDKLSDLSNVQAHDHDNNHAELHGDLQSNKLNRARPMQAMPRPCYDHKQMKYNPMNTESKLHNEQSQSVSAASLRPRLDQSMKGTPCLAGRLQHFSEQWASITSDKEILQTISGAVIAFENGISPTQVEVKRNYRFNTTEDELITTEINSLLDNGVLEVTEHSDDEYVSNIFLRKKKNGKYRMILNLKDLNQQIEYHHFKMETFEQALTIVSPNCKMASIDLKDAYYCVPVHPDFRKFLRFAWRGNLLQFTCFPNGLSSAPRKYTKIMKPVYATLRERGHNITGYIDDMLILAETEQQLVKSVQATIHLLESLGFIINWEKSAINPTTQISHLGFIINSETMQVTLSVDKRDRIQDMCTALYTKDTDTIRNVAKVIGSIVACFSAVELGPLHYRALEREKSEALKENMGNFDRLMCISEEMKSELKWWIDNVHQQHRCISKGAPDVTIETDASHEGWGAACTDEEIGGRWSYEEEKLHINYLELLAAFMALQAFHESVVNRHVLLMMDNTTAVAYIKNMGGKETNLNELAKRIWQWCLVHNIWLSASHIPGKLNVAADFKSRNFNDRTEWSLHPQIFDRLVQEFGEVDIDLFATRLNAKCTRYVSWHKEPHACYVDAFSRSWKNDINYIFPPFSLIGRCLQKIRLEEAEAVFVLPSWTTQSWFTNFLNLLVQEPIELPQMDNLLTLEHNHKNHPLRKRLRMLGARLSGKFSKNKSFQQKLQTLSLPHGDKVRTSSMEHTLGDGSTFVIQNRLIFCNQMLL